MRGGLLKFEFKNVYINGTVQFPMFILVSMLFSWSRILSVQC